MTQLSETIENLLNIPSREAGDAVMDGCFFINPFMTSTLKGDGHVQDSKLHISLDLFYADKSEVVQNTLLLLNELGSDSRYVISDPTYTYYEDAEMWQSAMNIIIIGGN